MNILPRTTRESRPIGRRRSRDRDFIAGRALESPAGSRLGQTIADGVTADGPDALEAQLAHDVGAMSLRRLRADAELAGDLLVRVAVGQKLQDLTLAIGQIGGRRDPLVLRRRSQE